MHSVSFNWCLTVVDAEVKINPEISDLHTNRSAPRFTKQYACMLLLVALCLPQDHPWAFSYSFG